MTLSSGTKLGPYEIVATIGAGGMGEVYRAKDPRLKRDVAIKVLPSSVAADADRLRRSGSANTILTATSRLSRVSIARYTSPMPPAPSRPMISYGPRRVPGGRSIW